MGDINIKKSEALEVLSMKVQCDVCWNRHIFQWLCSLKRSKIFRSTSLHHLHLKENGIELSFVGRCLNGRVFNSIDLLEHRCNLACVSLFYRYYSGFWPSKIRRLTPMNHVFLWNTRQLIAHCMTDKIRSLVGLFVRGIPFVQRL